MISWCKIDVGFFSNPKVMEVSNGARLAYIYLLCRNGAEEYDGCIPPREVNGRAFLKLVGCSPDQKSEYITELCESDMLSISDDGEYLITGWDDSWRPPRTSTERSRKSRARRSRVATATDCNDANVARSRKGTPRQDKTRQEETRQDKKRQDKRVGVSDAVASDRYREKLKEHELDPSLDTPKMLGLPDTGAGEDAALLTHLCVRLMNRVLADVGSPAQRRPGKRMAKAIHALVREGYGYPEFRAVMRIRVEEVENSPDRETALRWFTAETIFRKSNFERVLAQAENLGRLEDPPVATEMARVGPKTIGDAMMGVLKGIEQSANESLSGDIDFLDAGDGSGVG